MRIDLQLSSEIALHSNLKEVVLEVSFILSGLVFLFVLLIDVHCLLLNISIAAQLRRLNLASKPALILFTLSTSRLWISSKI